MKKTFIILFLSSFALFGQEPIYNINHSNLHLINYANYKYDTFYVNLDNSYEYYTNDKQFNSTNLNLNFDFENKIQLGINTNYNYLGKNNNTSNFDGIIKYKHYFNEQVSLIFAGNIGFINSRIDYSNLTSRYSSESPSALDLSYNSQNLNLGFGATIRYSYFMEAGVYLNHLNSPSLPLNNDEIPIKYTAFIRNKFGNFSSLLAYSYQDNYYLNPNDFDYYYSMLNYFGITLEYIPACCYSIGVGYKYLSNFSDIYTISNKLFIGGFKLTYSFSIMNDYSNKLAQLHQVGFNYNINRIRHRGVGFL